jgi:bifunctional DNA-binding transcriptional regulator/antitoxin component of YhaV-PrlF toxin-antitoxin module
MSKRFTITIEEDEFGELILPIPDDVCEDLGWTIGDELEFEVDDVTGTFTLRKVEDNS